MLRHRDAYDLAVAVYFDVDLEGLEARHFICCGSARRAAGSFRSLGKRVVDRVAGQRHAGLHIDLRVRDALPDQRAQHRLVSDQVRAKARCLVVLRHRDAHDLAVAVHFDVDLEGLEARHFIRCGSALGRFGFAAFRRSFLCRTAVCGGSGRQDRVLIPRVRLDAQRTFRVRKDLLAGVQECAGGNGSAGDLVHIRAQRIRIGRNADELLFKSIIAHAAAETRSLLQRTDVNLRDITLGTDAHRDRDLSAVALRRRRQRITLYIAGCVLANEDLVQLTSVREVLVFDLLVIAAGQHGVQCRFLGGELLLRDRALGDLVGHRKRCRRDEGKQEQAKAKFDNIIHAC